MDLRAKLVEAMAKAWVAYEGDDWEDLNGRSMAAVKACVERELEAALDCLAENADDWDHAAMDKFPKKDISDIGPRELLAVLREIDV